MNRCHWVLASLLVTFGASLGLAQQPARRDTSIVLIGSPASDRMRLDELFGRRRLNGSLIRSPSASAPVGASPRAFGWAWIHPVLDGAFNAKLPFSLNDGSLWAGRGWSERITAGVQGNVGRVRFVALPEIANTQNLGFPLLPSGIDGRSAYASPFWYGAASADLPLRFGNEPIRLLTPGQSAIWVPVGFVDAGLSTENQWWGPAIQNALVMSNNAPGIPLAFIRTNRPEHTRLGDIEAKLISGVLTESRYFDGDPGNDKRSISGVVATFSPAFEPAFTAGIARAVYGPIARTRQAMGHAGDAIFRWRTTRADSTASGAQAFDELSSFFWRWVFPEGGTELYGEWARMLPPASFREWLVAPQKTGGLTVGLQTAAEARGGVVRLQVELTNLEQTPPSVSADTLSFYTSRSVAQGYTQRGKSIGAAIGPGSSQFAALDYLQRRWDLGVFAQRIRWNNDAYYRQSTGFSFFSHDVTVRGGLRGSLRLGESELHLEYGLSQRLNFLFQNLRGGYGPERGNDVQDRGLKFWFSP